jgi:UDP-N-acetylmuramate--alanine ligase
VVEADESDASFLNLLPVMAVVTNIDADHMETYGHDFGRLKQAFVDFLHRMPFYGAMLCVDDPACARSCAGHRPSPPTALARTPRCAPSTCARAGQMHFTVQRRNGVRRPAGGAEPAGRAQRAQRPGGHRGGHRAEHSRRGHAAALAEFKGVGRRFQRYGELPPGRRALHLIDDYGHHPVEMAATLAAARGAFPGRLVLAFQPHRYTRTRDCFEDFVKVIGRADAVLLTEVYAAGEAPIVAADGRAGARAARGRQGGAGVRGGRGGAAAPSRQARDGDVVMCMGAGSIGGVPAKVVDLLQKLSIIGADVMTMQQPDFSLARWPC